MKKILIGLLLLAAIFVVYAAKEEVVEADVYVMNVNITQNWGGTTRVTLQHDANSTPWSISLDGQFPELWQGEHVHVRFHQYKFDSLWDFDKRAFKKIP
jgi:hypothetical protein